jgi:hypothetical protein
MIQGRSLVLSWMASVRRPPSPASEEPGAEVVAGSERMKWRMVEKWDKMYLGRRGLTFLGWETLLWHQQGSGGFKTQWWRRE